LHIGVDMAERLAGGGEAWSRSSFCRAMIRLISLSAAIALLLPSLVKTGWISRSTAAPVEQAKLFDPGKQLDGELRDMSDRMAQQGDILLLMPLEFFGGRGHPLVEGFEARTAGSA